MASQMVQGWHPNPQLMQPLQQPPPPQGWTGSWPPGGNVAFPPGYPGPPPMPGGAAAHPRWNAGYWQYNPLANVQNPQQPWAPGMGWFPPNFNPYKRMPKPPSPSYWNTKLSDNGLGLEGMVKRKDPSEYNDQEPHTPWIWNPPSLRESGERATPTRDFNPRRARSVDPGAHTATTPTREYGQGSRGSSQDNLPAQAHSQTPDRKPVGRGSGYFYGAQDNTITPTGPTRHSSDPTPSQNGSGPSGPSTSSQRSISQSDSWISTRSRSNPPTANDVPPFPAPTPTLHRSASVPQPVLTQEPESFTSKGDLQTTFSSSIIRTPTHYRRSTDEPVPSHHSRSPSGHASTPSRAPPVPDTLTRQASLPNVPMSTRDVYANFSEDLSNSLDGSTPPRAWPSGSAPAGPLSRSRTEPVVASLTTIHESSSALSSGELYLAPLHGPSSNSSTDSSPDPSPRRRDRRASPFTGSSPQSPEPSPVYRDRRPSPYASRQGALSVNTSTGTGAHARTNSHSQSQSHGHTHTYTHARPQPRSHSPSPSPHGRTHSPYAAAPGAGSTRRDPHPETARSSQGPSPTTRYATHARKARVGFWNRRGDYLAANTAYVVYAPHDRAYPEELRDYPGEREGYRDPHGAFVAWREDRPELPASLPYHGRPPAQPYESFVAYTYLQ